MGELELERRAKAKKALLPWTDPSGVDAEAEADVTGLLKLGGGVDIADIAAACCIAKPGARQR